MRRRALLTTALITPLAAVALRQSGKWRNRPANILMICIDDLNSWIGCLDPPTLVSTPAIDALASRGTLFRQAYCAAPYCNASRYAVFTGCLPSTTGIYEDQPYWTSTARRPNYIEHLRGKGYITFGAGKVFHGKYRYLQARRTSSRWAGWQEVENRPRLWDAYLTSGPEPLPQGYPLNGIRKTAGQDPRPWSPQFDWGVLSSAEEAAHPDVRTVDAIIDFLGRSHERPFFCAAGLYKPHLPWYAPRRCFERIPLESVRPPPIFADDLADLPPLARLWARQQPDHETLTLGGYRQRAIQAYLASVAFADEQVGRILTALDASQHRGDTLIALWSDNGFHLGEKLHWRKFTLWEQATRVPLIVVDPRHPHTVAEVHQPVSLIDLFPTLLGMAGVSPMQGVDGESLIGSDREGVPVPTRPVVMSWGQGNDSIRWGQWRYTYYSDGGEELYNLREDPWEHDNLADFDAFQEQREELKEVLQRVLIQDRRHHG